MNYVGRSGVSSLSEKKLGMGVGGLEIPFWHKDSNRPDNQHKTYTSNYLQSENETRDNVLKYPGANMVSKTYENIDLDLPTSYNDLKLKSTFQSPHVTVGETINPPNFSHAMGFARSGLRESLNRYDNELDKLVEARNERERLSVKFDGSPRMVARWPGQGFDFNRDSSSLQRLSDMHCNNSNFSSQREGNTEFPDFGNAKTNNDPFQHIPCDISDILNFNSKQSGESYGPEKPHRENNMNFCCCNIHRHSRRSCKRNKEKPINPLSPDYLDKLDAHLGNRMNTTPTDDKCTQTGIRKREQESTTTVKVHGRSTSLELPRAKFKRQTVTHRPRSRSVPRRNLKEKNVCPLHPHSWQGETTMGTEPVQSFPFKDQIFTRSGLNRSKAKVKTHRPVLKKTRVHSYDAIKTNIKVDNINIIDNPRSSLDKTQRQALKKLFTCMTKDEGKILMETVSSILNNRFARKNVVFKDKAEVLIPGRWQKTDVNGQSQREKTRDDDLCESFIQSYCRSNNYIPTESSSESYSLNFTNSEKSSLCSMSPSYSPTHSRCGEGCSICQLIDEDDSTSNVSRSKVTIMSPDTTKTVGKRKSFSSDRNGLANADKNKMVLNDKAMQSKLSLTNKSTAYPKTGAFLGNAFHRPYYDIYKCNSDNRSKHSSFKHRDSRGQINSTLYHDNFHNGKRGCLHGKLSKASEPDKSKNVMYKNNTEMNTGKQTSIELKEHQHCVRTPTPSPPCQKLCLPTKRSVKSTEENQSDNLNASCSTVSSRCVLKHNNSKSDLNSLSFDLTTKTSETSISQKIAELDISMNSDITGNIENKQETPKNEHNNTCLNGSERNIAGRVETFQTLKIINSDERLKQEMLLHINRNTQNLLDKANEKIIKVERFLDSVTNGKSTHLHVKAPENYIPKRDENMTDPFILDDTTKEREIHSSDISIDRILRPGQDLVNCGNPIIVPTSNKCMADSLTFAVLNENDFQIKTGPHDNLTCVSTSHLNKMSNLSQTVSSGNHSTTNHLTSSKSKKHFHSSSLTRKEESAVHNTSSSSSLATSSLDSSLLPSDSPGSYMKVTKLDETFTYDKDISLHRLAGLCLTKSIFTNNTSKSKHELQRQREEASDKSQYPSILVKTYNVTASMPVKTSFCTYDHDTQSSIAPKNYSIDASDKSNLDHHKSRQKLQTWTPSDVNPECNHTVGGGPDVNKKHDMRSKSSSRKMTQRSINGLTCLSRKQQAQSKMWHWQRNKSMKKPLH